MENGEEAGWRDSTGARGNFQDGGDVHDLDGGDDGFMRERAHENLPSWTFLYVQVIIDHLNKALKRTHC